MIEGNTFALKEVERLLREGKAVGSKELAEYLEVEGHAKAAQWVYAQAVEQPQDWSAGERINLTELRQIHKLVVEPAWLHSPPAGLYPPAVIYKRDRTRYLNALGRADRGDASPLAEIFARAVTDGIYRFLLPVWRGRSGLSRSVRWPTPSSRVTHSPSRPSVAGCARFAGRISGTRRGRGCRSTRSTATSEREFDLSARRPRRLPHSAGDGRDR